MLDLKSLQQEIVARTGIAFDNFNILVYDEEEKAEQVAQILAEQAEAGEESFALLTEMAHHADTAVKMLAGMTLECFQSRFDDAAYAMVRRLVRDMEEYVARHGGYALGHFATHRDDARAYVWELCEGDWEEMRYAGVGALGTMGVDMEAHRRLVKMLHQDNAISVRRAAARILAKVQAQNPDEARHAVIENLRLLKQESVQEALASLEGKDAPADEQVLAVLAALVQDGSARVREVAVRSLQALAKEHPDQVLTIVLPLVRDESYDVRDGAQRCLEAIVKTQGEPLFPTIAALAGDDQAGAREVAARLLDRFHRWRGGETLALLERLARDDEKLVRRAIALSLEYMRLSYPGQALTLLARLAQDEDRDVRYAAAFSLHYGFAKDDPWQVLDLLTTLVDDKSASVRKGAAYSLVVLAKYQPEPCLPLILKLAHDASVPEAARDAGAALETIIDRQPTQALILLDQLLRARPQMGALERIARMGRRDRIARIAQRYLSLWQLVQDKHMEPDRAAILSASREGRLLLGLRVVEPSLADLLNGLKSFIAGFAPLEKDFAHGHEVKALFEWAQFCLKCQSLADFTRPQAWQTLDSLHEPFLLGEMIDFARQLAQARDQVAKYLARTDRREQEMLLVEVLRILESAEAFAGGTLYPPYQPLARRIVAHWRELTRIALENLRGRALLRLRFLSEEYPLGQAMDVGIEVTNLGDETAEEVTLRVAESPDYDVVHTDPPLEYLTPGAYVTWQCTLQPCRIQATRVTVTAQYRQRGLDTAQTVEHADVLRFFDQVHRYPFVPLPANPYVTGGALQTDDVFFGREELIADIADDLQGMHQDNVIVLYGQRRTGKTSLLYALQRHLPKERYIPVLFDTQGVNSLLSLFWGLANQVYDACVRAGYSLREPARADYTVEAAAQFENGFLRQVTSILGERRLLLMIDEFEFLDESVKAGHLPKNVFPFFRHLMQHQRQVSFIFCGTHQLQELTRQYWQIFFNAAMPRRVTFLDEEATLELIQEPVRGYFAYDELALKQLLTLTGGHPLFTQLLCHGIVRFMSDQRRGYVTRNEVDAVVRQFVQTGHDHLDYIWTRSTPVEQAVLLALAEETHRQQRPVVLWPEVEVRLDARLPLRRDEVGEAWTSLEKRELTIKEGNKVRFTMGLISEWVALHHSWASEVRRR